MQQADIGLIGMGVMGQNLALNMNDKGFKVAVYNWEPEPMEAFLNGAAKDTDIIGGYPLDDFISKLQSPRKVMMMITAGSPVDQVIEQLIPFLDTGDIIIDGGNSHYPDSERRTKHLQEKGLRFIGAGVSGGEEGARNGASIMPGGDPSAWPEIKPILQAISAQVDAEPCCQWVGEGGSGHYVKMVHNGIEYGDMQLISEAYQLMHEGLNLNHTELESTFRNWNQGVLDSYLIEITAEIMAYQDEDGLPLLEKILDCAGQKGTGKWTGMNALDLGVPLTLIGEAVFARCLSAHKQERIHASDIFSLEIPAFSGDKTQAINDIRDALYASKIISYAQGFMLMREAAHEYGWNLDYGNIALLWRGGCIIRSQFLGNIKQAFTTDPQLKNLLLDEFFVTEIKQALPGWRRGVQLAVELGIPAPAFSSALAFFDGYRSKRGSANLLQAQRDYFGAHTYERVDKPRGEYFHTQWTQK